LLSDGAPASRTGLFGALFARGGAATAVSDRSWLAAMLDVEAALARACAKHGLCPTQAADAIADATADVTVFDIEGIGHEAAQSGTPVVSLVRALRVAVGEEYAARRARTSSTRRRCSSSAARWSPSWPMPGWPRTRAPGWRSSTARR
jgi:hypothetical protein